MNKQDFQEHIETKINALENFYERAYEFQIEKNEKRPKKKRWNEAKIKRATDNMYKTLIDNIYIKVKGIIEDNGKQPNQVWYETMEKQEIYENIEESLYEIEFE